MLLAVTTLLLVFNFFGHTIILYLIGFFSSSKTNENIKKEKKCICLIVPVFNEEKILDLKIENTKKLVNKTEHKIVVYFVDGGSKDKSLEILKSKSLPWLKTLESPESGKIPQLNYALSKLQDANYVFISDADSIIINDDAFDKAIEYLLHKDVGLVGAWTTPDPSSALSIEQAYWDKQNRFRYLETRKATSSIVTAQFYGFETTLLKRFPQDCIADDVYVSLLAHEKKKRIVYAHDIEAIEIRQAQNFYSLFLQKLRKANAYTKELIRFFPILKEVESKQRYTVLFKYYQFIILPWVSLFYLFSLIVNLALGKVVTASISFMVLFLSTLFASILITPPPKRTRGGFRLLSIFHTIVVFSMVNIILLINGLIFYTWQTDSKYKRVE
ncbi:MAG: glycosyltransferase [Oligoflexia bacterium]|nr:glycosyltransferase [Oligoflexia bacterium]